MEEKLKQLQLSICRAHDALTHADTCVIDMKKMASFDKNEIRLNQAESEIKILRRLLHDKTREVEALKIENSSLKKQFEDAQALVSKNSHQLDISNTTNQLLASRIHQLVEKNATLNEQLQQAHRQYATINKEASLYHNIRDIVIKNE